MSKHLQPTSKPQWEQKTETVNLSRNVFYDEDFGTVCNLEGMIRLLNKVQDETDKDWRYVDLEEDDHLFRLHFVRRKA